MIKLKQLISEESQRSVPIDINNLRQILPDYLSALNKYKSTYILYRGTDFHDAPYYIIKPSLYNRKSSNFGAPTNNLHNALFDILPSWRDWPKRSKSVVFSEDYDIARTYGEDVYIALPKNGSILAQCDSSDFWNAFSTIKSRFTSFNMHTFINTFYNFFKRICYKINYPFPAQIDSSSIQKILEVITSHTEISYADILKDTNNELFKTLLDDLTIHFKGNWIEYFDELLDPEKNNMTKTAIENFGGSEFDYEEVWTEGETLLIKKEKMENVHL